MSKVPPNPPPKRQAIVDRLRQRIDSFRKRHDSSQARLDETQPSRELKIQQDSRIFQSKILENKVKMSAKVRPEQMKPAKQEEIASCVGAESKAEGSNNTGLQAAAMKRKFPPSQVDGERGLQSNDNMSTPVPQKFSRFENQSDVHCNVKPPPNFNTGEEETMPLSSNTMGYAGAVNGHVADFVKSEDQSNAAPPYSGSACENLEITMTRPSQQYAARDFASPTYTSHCQSSEKSRTPEFTGSLKQESGLLSPGNDGSSTAVNGLLAPRTKTEDDFRLLTDVDSNTTGKDDLENQLSQFERVLQGIKSRDESSNENESSKESLVAKSPMLRSQPLGNGLNNSVSPDMAKVNSNQLGLPNDPSNTAQLPTSSATASQYGISRSTAQALQQFVIAQQEERLASKVRFERNLFLNHQGVSGEQNATRMAQRPNFPIRQRVIQQIQQRRIQKSRTVGGAPQLQARNPAVINMGPTPSYPLHSKVRYSGVSQTTQPVSFAPAATGRVHQTLMQPLHQSANAQQTQAQVQLPNISRHQINMLAQQQKLAFQQQMASRLPSYSQAQHLTRSTSVMDIRQKFPSGVSSTPTSQYPLHQQVARTQKPLSHLQHYNPPAYASQAGPPSRPIQTAYSSDYIGYQNPYQYGTSQEKLHASYQRHASMDDNLVVNRFRAPDMNNRNTFAFQRSSSLPSHAPNTNIFNQSSPPVVRLGQGETSLPDLNNNGNDHASQDLARVHPQVPLTHMKQQHLGQGNSLSMNQEQIYQGNGMPLTQSRPLPQSNVQTTLSNSFSNLLEMKSNSETSLFPFLGQDLGGGPADNSDFDSLLKNSTSEFDLLNMFESEPQKALQ